MDTTIACLDVVCGMSDSIRLLSSEAASAVGAAMHATDRALPGFWPLAAGMVGAVLASFSGLVADRLPRMMGWGVPSDPHLSLSHPPSRCDNCGHRLSALSLVPIVGWLVHRGRCPHCGGAVPPVYPIVETLAFVGSASIPALYGTTGTAAALCLCLWVLVAISWIDWRSHEIPDGLTVPLLFLGLLVSPFEPDAWSRILGAIVAGGFLWVAFVLTARTKGIDTMSYGDVALALALGAWLGGDKAIPFILASALCYLAYAVPLRLRGVVWVPMGPGLSAGFLLIATTGLSL